MARSLLPRASGERGVVILWAAFFLTMMLGFVALAIDVARLTTTKTQLQNAADAAALAGASAIDPLAGVLMPDSALARAQYTAAENRAFVNGPEPVNLLASDVSFPRPDEIRVTVRRDASTGGSLVAYVSRVLGVRGFDVRASASARVAPAEQVFCGLVPLWAAPPPGEARFETGCGRTYTLKEGGGGGAQGNYGGVTFPPCDGGPCGSMPARGANTFRCLLENGYCCTVVTGDVLTSEPGNMSGPVQKGVQARFARDTDAREGICYADYHGNGERVVMVPVTTRPANGRTDVTVQGFATFFLHAVPGSGTASLLEGEFLYDVTAGLTEGGGAGGSNGTVFSIRLVR